VGLYLIYRKALFYLKLMYNRKYENTKW
jgi:hypothetical protein